MYLIKPNELKLYTSLAQVLFGPQGKKFWSISVRLVGLIWLHLFIGTLDKNTFLHLEKHLNQEWAFLQLEVVGNQNCK